MTSLATSLSSLPMRQAGGPNGAVTKRPSLQAVIWVFQLNCYGSFGTVFFTGKYRVWNLEIGGKALTTKHVKRKLSCSMLRSASCYFSFKLLLDEWSQIMKFGLIKAT